MRGVVIFFAVAVIGFPVEAATLRVFTSNSLRPSGAIGTPTVFDQDDQTSTTENRLTSSLTSTNPVFGSTAISEASIDAGTGELRVFSSASPVDIDPPGLPFIAEADSLAIATLSEQFMVLGVGTLTALMVIDLEWSLTSFPVPPLNWQSQARIIIEPNSSQRRTATVAVGSNVGGSIDRSPAGTLDNFLISADFPVSATTIPRLVTIEWDFFTQISNGSGVIRGDNTASIFVQGSDGLSVTPTTPGFLSAPAFTEVVPLGSPIVFLGTGLALLGWIARHRRSS